MYKYAFSPLAVLAALPAFTLSQSFSTFTLTVSGHQTIITLPASIPSTPSPASTTTIFVTEPASIVTTLGGGPAPSSTTTVLITVPGTNVTTSGCTNNN